MLFIPSAGFMFASFVFVVAAAPSSSAFSDVVAALSLSLSLDWFPQQEDCLGKADSASLLGLAAAAKAKGEAEAFAKEAKEEDVVPVDVDDDDANAPKPENPPKVDCEQDVCFHLSSFVFLSGITLITYLL